MYSWNFFEVEMRPSASTHVYIKNWKQQEHSGVETGKGFHYNFSVKG